MKHQNIHKEDWDWLIILDACRYDYFKKNYKKYFNGKFEKRKSLGSATPEWLVNSFPNYYDDITYFSANPFINTHKVPILNSWEAENSKDLIEWYPHEHFRKIIDIWEKGWDEEYKTVLPETVTDMVLESKFKDKTDRRIVHYMQPHLPFIHPDYKMKTGVVNHRRRNLEKKNEEIDDSDIKRYQKIKDFVGGFLDKILKKRHIWAIRKLLDMPPRSGDYERIYRKGNLDKVPFYYEHSLNKAMREVQRLIENVDGKIVVSSDHGEAFGENNHWEHNNGKHIPILMEVPYLVID